MCENRAWQDLVPAGQERDGQGDGTWASCCSQLGCLRWLHPAWWEPAEAGLRAEVRTSSRGCGELAILKGIQAAQREMSV